MLFLLELLTVYMCFWATGTLLQEIYLLNPQRFVERCNVRNALRIEGIFGHPHQIQHISVTWGTSQLIHKFKVTTPKNDVPISYVGILGVTPCLFKPKHIGFNTLECRHLGPSFPPKHPRAWPESAQSVVALAGGADATDGWTARPSLARPKFRSLKGPHSLARLVNKMSLARAPSSSLILGKLTALSSFFAVGCGGVRWDKNARVPVRTQAPQPHHFSCCPADTSAALSWSVTGGVGVGWGRTKTFFCSRADTGTALSWSVTGGVGWGGTITFMFLCAHRHRNLIIFPAVLQTQALLFHDQLPVGWGGVRQ